MVIYTIGYGGRGPRQFLELLVKHGIRAIVDVRYEPHKAFCGKYVLAKSADRGIQALLAERGIAYFSFLQLGNEFRHEADWRKRFRRKLAAKGDELVKPLFSEAIPQPFCLMCNEKSAAECHRGMIAEVLEKKGCEIRHIE